MRWSCGVTTVSERFDTLLPRTLESLRLAQFPKPRLFIDGPTHIIASHLEGYPKTFRGDNIGVPGNWHLTLLELMIREPHTDMYAIFQDDLIAYRNLREYLERVQCPSDGYLNLYTWPDNAKRANGRTGFYKSNQRGKGAVALVFNRKVAETLVGHPHMLKKHTCARKSKQAVDGAIVTATNQAGLFEYVHNPSLVQHLGLQSTMFTNNGRRKRQQPQSPIFKGEEFDALSLLNPGSPDRAVADRSLR